MKQRIRKLIGWTATISLVALAAGCSSNQLPQLTSQLTGASSPSLGNKPSPTTASKSSVPPLPKTTYGMGQVVSIRDKDLNFAFSVKGTREHPGKRVLEPNPGNKWILVNTTIANRGQKPLTISVVSFELRDSKNKQYDVALLAGALEDVQRPTGSINSGEEQRGEVAFEVPKSATGLKLLFKPNYTACQSAASKPKELAKLNCEPVVVKLQ